MGIISSFNLVKVTNFVTLLTSVRLTVSVMVILAAESLVVDLCRRKFSINSLLTNKR